MPKELVDSGQSLSQPSWSNADIVYDAFLSYRRQSGRRLASWLHQTLEARYLRSSIRRAQSPRTAKSFDRLRVFRDVHYERSTADFWEEKLLPSLRQARWLIVVVTKDIEEKQSDGSANWVEREIDAFLQHSDIAHVIAVLSPDAGSSNLPRQLATANGDLCIVQFARLHRWWAVAPYLPKAASEPVLQIVRLVASLSPEQLRGLERAMVRRRIASLAMLAAFSVASAGGATLAGYGAIARQQQAAAEADASSLWSGVGPDQQDLFGASMLKEVWLLRESNRTVRDAFASQVLHRPGIAARFALSPGPLTRAITGFDRAQREALYEDATAAVTTANNPSLTRAAFSLAFHLSTDKTDLARMIPPLLSGHSAAGARLVRDWASGLEEVRGASPVDLIAAAAEGVRKAVEVAEGRMDDLTTTGLEPTGEAVRSLCGLLSPTQAASVVATLALLIAEDTHGVMGETFGPGLREATRRIDPSQTDAVAEIILGATAGTQGRYGEVRVLLSALTPLAKDISPSLAGAVIDSVFVASRRAGDDDPQALAGDILATMLSDAEPGTVGPELLGRLERSPGAYESLVLAKALRGHYRAELAPLAAAGIWLSARFLEESNEFLLPSRGEAWLAVSADFGRTFETIVSRLLEHDVGPLASEFFSALLPYADSIESHHVTRLLMLLDKSTADDRSWWGVRDQVEALTALVDRLDSDAVNSLGDAWASIADRYPVPANLTLTTSLLRDDADSLRPMQARLFAGIRPKTWGYDVWHEDAGPLIAGLEALVDRIPDGELDRIVEETIGAMDLVDVESQHIFGSILYRIANSIQDNEHRERLGSIFLQELKTADPFARPAFAQGIAGAGIQLRMTGIESVLESEVKGLPTRDPVEPGANGGVIATLLGALHPADATAFAPRLLEAWAQAPFQDGRAQAFARAATPLIPYLGGEMLDEAEALAKSALARSASPDLALSPLSLLFDVALRRTEHQAAALLLEIASYPMVVGEAEAAWRTHWSARFADNPSLAALASLDRWSMLAQVEEHFHLPDLLPVAAPTDPCKATIDAPFCHLS